MSSPDGSSAPAPPSSEASTAVVEGERFGHLIRLRPEFEERYRILHAHPFPGVLDQIRAANLRNYSIFLREGLLFSFYEYVGNTYEADMGAMAEDETVQDWWTLTDPMQKSLLPEEAEGWWLSMEELYHGGAKRVPSAETEKKAYVRRLHDDSAVVRSAYEETKPDLDILLGDAPLQNYAVYQWRDRLYTYFEYTGDRFSEDIDRLRHSPVMQKLNDALGTVSGYEEGRRPMESVFYLA